MIRIGGLTLLSRGSDKRLILASYHPRSSLTWRWSVTLCPRGERRKWLCLEAPEYRRGQWHDYIGPILISRQDYHLTTVRHRQTL